jgi:hypothetical protein
MISLNKEFARPKPRRSSNAYSIIRFFTKETRDGDPRFLAWFFAFGMLFLLTQGAIVVAPLMWLGIL